MSLTKPKPWNALTDAEIEALSIVTKGANRERFFLKKQHSAEADLITMPGGGDMIAKSDWSRVYCVVAAPDGEEDPGVLASDQSVPDRWASEDEIRKAQESFVKNGSLVNKLHESLEPYGDLIDNAVAPADFTVDGIDGPKTIRKGTWWVSIAPTIEGRAKIDKGEFTGVSIQGTAVRTLMEKAFNPSQPRSDDGRWRVVLKTRNGGQIKVLEEDLSHSDADAMARGAKNAMSEAEKKRRTVAVERVEKAEQFTKPGTANVSPSDRGKLAPLLAHYAGMAHPFTSCYRDQVKHGLSADHAKRRCAVLKDLIRGTTKWRVSKGAANADPPWDEETGAALDRIEKSAEDAGHPIGDFAPAFYEAVAKARFDESKVKRKGGKFAPKAGGGLSASKKPKASTPEEAQQNRNATAANILGELGYKGQKLGDAIRDFQKTNGLPVTGKADAQTMVTLRAKMGGAREKRESVREGTTRRTKAERRTRRRGVKKAKLDAATRKKLPSSAFALPGSRSYPIHDESHARNALARASGKPEEDRVKAAVYRRYPNLRPEKVGKLERVVMAIAKRLGMSPADLDDGLADGETEIVTVASAD